MVIESLYSKNLTLSDVMNIFLFTDEKILLNRIDVFTFKSGLFEIIILTFLMLLCCIFEISIFELNLLRRDETQSTCNQIIILKAQLLLSRN